jgi:hypothetical protein
MFTAIMLVWFLACLLAVFWVFPLKLGESAVWLVLRILCAAGSSCAMTAAMYAVYLLLRLAARIG